MNPNRIGHIVAVIFVAAWACGMTGVGLGLVEVVFGIEQGVISTIRGVAFILFGVGFFASMFGIVALQFIQLRHQPKMFIESEDGEHVELNREAVPRSVADSMGETTIPKERFRRWQFWDNVLIGCLVIAGQVLSWSYNWSWMQDQAEKGVGGTAVLQAVIWGLMAFFALGAGFVLFRVVVDVIRQKVFPGEEDR